MVRICLNVLVGIPASGKTTYCQQIEACSSRTFNVVHLCYDSYIEIDSKFDKFCIEAGSYRIDRQTLFNSVDAIIRVIVENDLVRLDDLLIKWKNDFKNPLKISPCSGASQDYLFLIDDNNYYRSMRWCWARLARKLSISFFETYFNIPLRFALDRNEKRMHAVPRSVITRMWTRLEKPCKELFRWESNAICIQEQFDIACILARVEQSLGNPEKTLETLCKPVALPLEQSKVHKLDVLLRKAVSKNIGSLKDSMSKQELKSYAELLQERKKSILEQMRHGEQNYPDELLPYLVQELL